MRLCAEGRPGGLVKFCIRSIIHFYVVVKTVKIAFCSISFIVLAFPHHVFVN